MRVYVCEGVCVGEYVCLQVYVHVIITTAEF